MLTLIEKSNDNPSNPPPHPSTPPLLSRVIKIKVPLTYVNNSEVTAFASLLALAGIFLGAERLLELADVWTHGHTALYKISCHSNASR